MDTFHCRIRYQDPKSQELDSYVLTVEAETISSAKAMGTSQFRSMYPNYKIIYNLCSVDEPAFED